MQTGTFPARVTDYGIGETQEGEPQVFLTFAVAFPTGDETMTKYGSLKEGKGRDFTLKMLLAVGYAGSDLSDLLDGPDGGAGPVKIGAEAQVVCQEHTWKERTTIQIAFVNRPGAGGAKRADPASARTKLAALNIRGDMARVRAEVGVAKVTAPTDDVSF